MEQESQRQSRILMLRPKSINESENNYRFHISGDEYIQDVQEQKLCPQFCTCPKQQTEEEDFQNYRYYISGTPFVSKEYRKKQVTETPKNSYGIYVEGNAFKDPRNTCPECIRNLKSRPVEGDTYAPVGERGNDLRVYKCVVKRVQPKYKDNYSFINSK